MWPLLLLGGLGALLAGGASKPAPQLPTLDLGSSFLAKYGPWHVFTEPTTGLLFAVTPELAGSVNIAMPNAAYQGLAAVWYAQQKLAGQRVFTNAMPFPGVPGVLLRAGSVPNPGEVEET